MALDGAFRRRLLGSAALIIALLMLILGQTVLQLRLRGGVFVCYWLVCLAFTVGAIIVALVDTHATKTELRKQNRELFEQTLRDVQVDAAARHREQKRGGGLRANDSSVNGVQAKKYPI